MTKEIAFLIWLYDRQLQLIDEGEHVVSFHVAEIREEFAETFGIDDDLDFENSKNG